MVVLTGGKGDCEKEGLLVVESNVENKNKPEIGCDSDSSLFHTLQIRIGTAKTTYHGRVPLSQVKLSDRHLLSKFLLQDGREHPKISITFQHHNDESLKVSIQQRLQSSGLMKLIFLGFLQQESANTRQKNVLDFCQSLGEAINGAQTEISDLQRELTDTQQRLQGWKDTAEKLDRDVWQREKDELLDKFLKLFQEAKTRANEKIQTLQEELIEARAKTSVSKNRVVSRALELDDAPDDLESREPFPLEQVAALAQGRKTNTGSGRQQILDASQALPGSRLKQQAKEYESRKAKKKNMNMEKTDCSPPPAAKRVKREKSSPSSDSELQEDSEDEAMRRAILASFKRNDDDKSQADASF